MKQLLGTILILLSAFLGFSQVNKSAAKAKITFDAALDSFTNNLANRPDLAVTYLRKAEQFKALNTTQQVRVLLAKCKLADNQRKFQDELSYAKQAVDLIPKLKNDSLAAKCYQHLAYIYDQLGNFNQSIEHYFKALELSERTKNEMLTAKLYNNIGAILEINKEYAKAEEYFLKALHYKLKGNDTNSIASTYNNLAVMCFNQKKYEQAITYYELAYEYLKASDSYKVLISLAGLGDVEYALKNYNQSLRYLQKAEGLIANFPNDSRYAIYVYMNLGRTFLALNETEKSIFYLRKAELMANEIGANFEVIQIYYYLHEYYKKGKKFNVAFDYLEKSIQVKDSIFNDQRSKELVNLLAVFETEAKNKTISSLKDENELQKAINKEQELRFNLAVLLVVFLIFVVGAFYNRYKERQRLAGWLEEQVTKRTEVITAQNEEKTIMLREIHHRVKNNLQLISSFLSLQRHFTKEKTAEQIILETQERVRCMSIIHEKLYQTENLKDLDSKTYLEEIAHYVAQSYNLGRDIKLETSIDSVRLPLDIMIPCGLILNELISNSYKYGFADREHGTITVSFTSSPQAYLLAVKDDGVGLPENFNIDDLSSLGMTIVSSLAEQLDGELAIQSDNGASFAIKFS